MRKITHTALRIKFYKNGLSSIEDEIFFEKTFRFI